MAEEIVSRLVAKVDGFLRGFDQADRKVKDFSDRSSRNIEGFQNRIQNLGRIITAVFVTGAVARAVQRQVELGDQLDKTSRQLGITAREMANLNFAAERNGVSSEQVARGFAQAQKNLLDFVRGTGEAKRELEATGLTATQAAELLRNPMEAFLTVGDAVNRSTNKTAASMKLLGESGRQLIPFFQGGREELERLFALNEKLNPNLDEQARLSAQLKDEMTNLTTALDGLAVRGLLPVLPHLTRFVELMTELASFDTEKLGFRLNTVFQDLATSLAFARDLLLDPLNFEETIKKYEALDRKFQEERRRRFAGPNAGASPPVETLPLITVAEQAESARLAGLIKEREARIALLRLEDEQTELTAERIFVMEKGVVQLKAQLAVQKEIEAAEKGKRAVDPLVGLTAELEKKAQLLELEKQIQEVRGRRQELRGVEIVAGATDDRRRAIADSLKRVEEAEFQLQLIQRDSFADPLAVAAQQLEVYDRQIIALKNRQEQERESVALARELALIEQEREDLINRINAAEQAGLGTAEVRNATARQEARLGSFQDRIDEARFQLERGRIRVDARGNPITLPGTDILNQIEVLQAEKAKAEEQFRRDGDVTFARSADLLEERIQALQVEFDNLDFKNLETQLQSIGGIFNTTVGGMLQGLLLNTQEMSDVWENFLRNLAASALSQLSQNFVSGGLSAVAGIFSGGAGLGGGQAGSGETGPFAGLIAAGAAGFTGFDSGGSFVVNGLGGIDRNLVSFRASRGERVTIETPEQQRARGTGPVVVNVINNAGVEAEQREEPLPGGGRKIDVIIGGMVARDIRSGAGPVHKAMKDVFGMHRQSGLR